MIVGLSFRNKRKERRHGKEKDEYGTKETKNVIDYVQWDEPNNLVDRLELLVDPLRTGHSGNTNEVISTL